MKCFLVLIFIGGLEAGLRDKAKRIYIGTAATVSELADAQEAAMAGKEFNMLTPGNEMKWDATEQQRGRKTYTQADSIVNYAVSHTMRVRGHCLVWHSQLPGWLNSLSKADLHSAMESRIKDIVGHYKGKLYAWDVVNEVFEENGNLRSSIWSNHFGETFISDAFKLAHAVDPSVKLYINDYNVEGINAKSTGLYNLVKKLKSQGVPIHGVGFQTHLIVGQVPSSLQSNLKRFADLGVEVAITEMDVRIKLPSNSNTLQQQAKDYGSAVAACEAVSKCVGVTFWGFTDKHSWIPQVSHGWGDALPFDKNFKAKPAVAAIEAVLK